MPITGILTAFATSYVILKAIGLIAGPDRPAVLLLNTVLRLSMSMAMALNVLTRLSASAPTSSHAFAISTMSLALGDSFTISGLSVASLTFLTTSFATQVFMPKAMPPLLTFGHEILSSII